MFGRNLANALIAMSLLSALSSAARAQDAAVTAPAIGAPVPEFTPATPVQAVQQPAINPNLLVDELHGDWSVRCFNVESQAPCDILQLGTNAETQQRVSLTSIAYVPTNQSYLAQIIVPLGVALSRGLSLEAGEASLVGIKFNRCEVDGCYVEIAFPQATIEALSTLTENTLITVIAYGQGDTLEMPFSINGFAEAIEHMVDEAEDRAVEPAPQ